ncbi:hypothetical protein PG984_011298 [Apiospora sp. TS-2023a]
MDIRISSRIDEYGRDTAIVIWWLRSASSEHGWIAPADGKIVTRHLREQAQTIFDSEVRMPLWVKRPYTRALSLRKRCQAWFEEGGRTTPENIATHRHFIQVLEECYDIFDAEDFFEEEEDTQDEQDQTASLANAFAAMVVEYLSSSEEDAKGSSGPSVPQTVPPTPNDDRPQTYTGASKAYCDLDPKWDVACQVYSLFEDVHFLRSEIQKLYAEIDAGTLSLPVVSIIIMHCIRLVGQMEEKVYNQFPGVYTPTGKPYEDMAAVLYDMMKPKITAVTYQQETAEYSEADEFVFLGIGRTLRKLTETAHMTREFEWPPPLPEARMYCMENRDFILSHSFERFDKEDIHLSQFGMDIHLGEILVRDSYVDKEATRLSRTPLQAAMAELWKSKATTVQSVFAALVTLDFQSVTNKPAPNLTGAQKDVSDAKKRVYDENSFYPFSPKNSLRSRDRALFASGELPEEFVQQHLDQAGINHVPYNVPGGRTFRIIPLNDDPEFFHKADPVLLGIHTLLNDVPIPAPGKSPFGEALNRLRQGAIGYDRFLKDLEWMVFATEDDAVTTKPEERRKKPKESKGGKKGGKGGKPKRKKPKKRKMRMTLAQSLSQYRKALGAILTDPAESQLDHPGPN